MHKENEEEEEEEVIMLIDTAVSTGTVVMATLQ
jgi:hypothetical protein